LAIPPLNTESIRRLAEEGPLATYNHSLPPDVSIGLLLLLGQQGRGHVEAVSGARGFPGPVRLRS
jgi:hypothetical protein